MENSDENFTNVATGDEAYLAALEKINARDRDLAFIQESLKEATERVQALHAALERFNQTETEKE